MRNHNHFSISGKGYYIALILCAAAIGISGYLYHKNAPEAENVSLAQVEDATVPAGTSKAEDVEVLATQPGRQEQKPTSPSTPSVPASEPATQPSESAPPTEKPALKTAAPVEGEEIFSYSMDCLSYNETTRDWRVHNGVDIAAQEGTEVHAAADGTVYTVYEDDTMGYTVVIRHEGGYTTRYSSLAAEPTVAAGDRVSVGQAIGCVGTTALVETTMSPHVHFAVTCQNAPMDPAEFLAGSAG